jgi:lambda family phage portal protein
MPARVRIRDRIATGIMAAFGWSWQSGASSSFKGSKIGNPSAYKSFSGADSTSLRTAARVAYWDSLQARALIGRLVDSVIGSGLTLEASPLWDMVAPDWTEDQRRKWLRNVEMRWTLWSNSTDPDATGRMTLQQLQRFEFLNRLRDGETFPILRYQSNPALSSPVQIQMVDAEQVQDDFDSVTRVAVTARGNTMTDGIETDAFGREVAIYVRDPDTHKTVRVPVSGASRRFVLHPAIFDAVGQVRGVSAIGHLIHDLQKLTDYSVLEIQAAVVNATIAAYIVPSANANASKVVGAALRGTNPQAAATSSSEDKASTVDLKRGGLFVQSLKAGEDLKSFDTKRPNGNFAAFCDTWTAHISMSLGIPIEVLKMSFNANYSASRASLVLFWTVVEGWRDSCAAMFLNPIYAAWFAEEVAAGSISAPGFGETPTLSRAWLNSDWLGSSKPSIDPQKEANAADVRIAAGLTTRTREAKIYNGSEFTDNVGRLKIENAALKDAGGGQAPKVPTTEEPEETPEEKKTPTKNTEDDE